MRRNTTIASALTLPPYIPGPTIPKYTATGSSAKYSAFGLGWRAVSRPPVSPAPRMLLSNAEAGTWNSMKCACYADATYKMQKQKKFNVFHPRGPTSTLTSDPSPAMAAGGPL